MARHQPVVLSVDDVHRADAAWLHFLAYLAPRIGGLPVLIAMATRDGEP